MTDGTKKRELSAIVSLRRENIKMGDVIARYGKMMRELDILLSNDPPDIVSIKKIIYKAQLDILDL